MINTAISKEEYSRIPAPNFSVMDFDVKSLSGWPAATRGGGYAQKNCRSKKKKIMKIRRLSVITRKIANSVKNRQFWEKALFQWHHRYIVFNVNIYWKNRRNREN